MPPSRPPEKRYSEQEMRAIFARASRAQHAADAPAEGGLTLAELQEIGAASGIAPDHVAAAAAALEAEGPPPRTLLGAPLELRRARRLPPVSDAAWEALVAELRATYGDGVGGQVGRVREWHTAPAGNANGLHLHATLRPEPDGQVRFEIEQRGLRAQAVGLAAGAGMFGLTAALFAALILTGVAEPALWVAAALFVAAALAMGPGVGLGTRAWARRRARAFEATLDRAELLARSDDPATAGPEVAPEVTGPETATLAPSEPPRLDLDALPDAPATDPARTPARDRS